MQNLEELGDAELIRRAVAEYTKAAGGEVPLEDSSVENLRNRRKYVVLRKGTKVLAVYRVDPDGLKRQDAGRAPREETFG